VADRTSGERPGNSTNGAIGSHQESTVPESGANEDVQTVADHEQTIADADQTISDSDQTLADSDQAASDTDQAASDRDLEQGGNLAVHEQTRHLRDRTARQRDETAHTRIETAARRDAVASDRDRAALARDRVAAQQDRELATRDVAWSADGDLASGAESRQRALDNRTRAAADRAAAAEGRGRAADDRAQAARDRADAAHDRATAQADREALVHQLKLAETDVLTGARTRGPGLADLDHEINRVRRTMGAKLVVAYVDIVGLKAVNDSQGHSSGDALLKRAVRTMRGNLRSYDLIVRVGGDEFLCVMAGATLEDAHARFDAIKTGLAVDLDHCEIKVGFAELGPSESAAELIDRADAALPVTR
jgi:diguanylate cyclase (GGDEF)-like protein